MTPVIAFVWWIGLLGALALTLIILKEARLVLTALRDIQLLADRTAVAARGIARHVAPVPELPSRLGTSAGLLAAAQRLHGAAGGFAREVETQLGPSAAGRLGKWIAEWLTGRRTEARG